MIVRLPLPLILVATVVIGCCHGLIVQRPNNHYHQHHQRIINQHRHPSLVDDDNTEHPSRRVALERLVQSSATIANVVGVAFLSPSLPAFAADNSGGSSGKTVRQERLVDSFDVDNYLKTGFVNNPMGVSGQAGKSRPETGVVLRDGSEASQDGNGNVLAEILLKDAATGQPIPVLATFTSPWPLGR